MIWRNNATFAVTVEFDKLHPLFGVDSIDLQPNQEQELTIQKEAHMGNPGFKHSVQIEEAKNTGGATIIVCPPLPLPCN